jgi:hypothetical protein
MIKKREVGWHEVFPIFEFYWVLAVFWVSSGTSQAW